MVEVAVTLGILCLLLAALVCFLRNRMDRRTPRNSNSIQESGEDDMSENHRMDVFSQERFPIIREIQNRIQRIYHGCRWESFRVVRSSSVSTQTDPCGQPEQTFVQRPLATNLSNSLTPLSTQSSYDTVIASYREAKSHTPNRETSRRSETGTETEAGTDPLKHDTTARQTAEEVTDVANDPPRHEDTARQTEEAEVVVVTDPLRHEATVRQTDEAETDVANDPPRHEATARQTTEGETDGAHYPPRHEATVRQTDKAEADVVTDPLRHEAIVRQIEEAETDVANGPPRHEATARQTEEAEADVVTDPLRHEAIVRQIEEAETDVANDPPRHEATARQTEEAEADVVTDPLRHEATARQTAEAETDVVNGPLRHEATVRQTKEAEADVVTDQLRHEATVRQTKEAEADVVTDQLRHEATARQTDEAEADVVTDQLRHEATVRQTEEAETDVTNGPPRHEATARQTDEAETDVANDPPRHKATARQPERLSTMAVTERSDTTAGKVTKAVKSPSNHHALKRGTTETNAAAFNDVTWQKSFSDGQIPHDIDIHQSTRDTEDLGDEPEDFMFPAANKEKEGFLFKEKAIDLKTVSKKGSGDTAYYEMSLNEKDNLNLLCDSETSSSRSSNSSVLTKEEESPKDNRSKTDQADIPLSKSQLKFKLEMGSLQNYNHDVVTSTLHVRDLKASQKAKKTQEQNTDQGTLRMMSLKEDTSKKYKPSQSKTSPMSENPPTEKKLGTLTKSKEMKKCEIERHLDGVVAEIHSSDSVTVEAKQRRDEVAAGRKKTVSDLAAEIHDYDADDEYSSSDAETENNLESKRSLSAHEEPTDGNRKQSCSDRLKNRSNLPYTNDGAFCQSPSIASSEKQNEKNDAHDGEFRREYTTEIESQVKNPKGINDRQDEKVTLDAAEMDHVDDTKGCNPKHITDEVPQAATMATSGEEWSQSPKIELTLGHFSNSEPWKPDSKSGSDCHSTSIESDAGTAKGSQISENGNLELCGSKYSGANERIKGDDGREAGNYNPEDPGSIQHDNETANGTDDTMGDEATKI